MTLISPLEIHEVKQSNRQDALSGCREILIADAGIEDLETMLDGLKPGVDAWLVQPGEDAIGRIIAAIATVGLTGLHLLAHGAPGEIRMGGRAITAADFRHRFDGVARRDLDIAFWSCRTGANEAGQRFVQAVAEATGARIMAARGLVGNVEKGGGWDLNCGVAAPFTQQALSAFKGVLANLSGATFTVADIGVTVAANGSDTNYFLTDAASALAAASLPALGSATAVTASDTTGAADAAALFSVFPSALYSTISDTAAALLVTTPVNSIALGHAAALAITGTTDAADAATLYADNHAVTFTEIADTATDLLTTTPVNPVALGDAMALTVTGTTNAAQAAALSAAFTYASFSTISDTATALLTTTPVNPIALGDAVALTVTGTTDAAQAATLFSDNPAVTFAAITDTAADLLSTTPVDHIALGNAAALTVTGATDVADAVPLYADNAAVKFAEIKDSVAALLSLMSVDATVLGSATTLTVTGAATDFFSFGTTTAPGVDALLALSPNILVSGATTAQLAALDAANAAGSTTVASIPLSTPNTYLIETPTTPAWTVSNNMVADIVDAAGPQTIHIAAGGKLNLSGSDGNNVIVFDSYASTDLTLAHFGTTVIFDLGSAQIASIATDATYAPTQTITFTDGSYQLTNDGTALTLVGIGAITAVEPIV